MKLEDIDTAKMEFTEDELDNMITILEKAEEIKKDSALFNVIKKRMDKRVKSIKSLADLKSRANQASLEEDTIKG